MSSDEPLSLTQEILNKNSEAVLLLQRRKYLDGKASLQECLCCHLPQVEARAWLSLLVQQQEGDIGRRGVRSGIRTQSDNGAGPGDNDASSRQEASEVMATYGMPINVGSQKVDVVDFYNAQGGFLFFDQAIVTTSLEAKDGDYHPQFIRAILLYNLALATHQEAILPQGDRLYCPFLPADGHPISLACRLYELALSSLEQVLVCCPGLQLRCIKHEDIALVSMAILNNLAHIQGTYFVNFGQASFCVARLRKILVHTRSTCSISCFPRPRPFTESETYRFFCHNVAAVPSAQFCTLAGAA